MIKVNEEGYLECPRCDDDTPHNHVDYVVSWGNRAMVTDVRRGETYHSNVVSLRPGKDGPTIGLVAWCEFCGYEWVIQFDQQKGRTQVAVFNFDELLNKKNNAGYYVDALLQRQSGE